jgi:hypothetical protein
VRDIVSPVLQVEFTGHFSDYSGAYYSSGGPRELFTIECNLAAEEDGSYYKEEEFSAYETLLRVDRTSRGDFIRELLSKADGLSFLRRSYPSAKARSRARRSSLS